MLIRCSISIALASQPFKLDRMIMQSSINQFLMETTSLVGPRLTLLLFKIIMLPLIVFMSPETATQAPWRNIYQTSYFKEHLVLVAVDEAHCIPEWYTCWCHFDLDYNNVSCRGPDFRTSFKKIGGLRALAGVPFMALSASAPPPVAEAIEKSLVLKSPVHIENSLDRPNIFFSVSKSKGLAVSNHLFMHAINLYYSSQKRDLASLASVLSKARRPAEVPKTIIFCQTKNDAAKVYALLLKSACVLQAQCVHVPLFHYPRNKDTCARKVFNRHRAQVFDCYNRLWNGKFTWITCIAGQYFCYYSRELIFRMWSWFWCMAFRTLCHNCTRLLKL